MATVATVAAVATDEPEVAENIVAVATFAWIRPPGSQDTHRSRAAYVRVATPLRTSISPKRTKKGIAIRVAEFDDDQTILPKPLLSGKLEKNVSMPKPSRNRTMPTGIDKDKRAKSPTDT